MNDQHHPHAGYVTDAAQTGGHGADPHSGAYSTADYDAGQSGHTQYTSQDYGDYAAYAEAGVETGYADAYGSTAWDTGSAGYASVPADGSCAPTSYDAGGYTPTGQWDATAWTEAQQSGTDTYDSGAFASYGSQGYDATAQWTTAGFETGAYDATAWNQAAAEPLVPQQYSQDQYGQDQYGLDQCAPDQYETQTYETRTYEVPDTLDTRDYEQPQAAYAHPGYTEAEHPATLIQPRIELPDPDQDQGSDAGQGPAAVSEPDAFHDAETMFAMAAVPESAAAFDLDGPDGHAGHDGHDSRDRHGDTPAAHPGRRAASGGRARRRTPAKRSALLTVAVPSVCVMGVAGIAAASVSGLTGNSPEKPKKETSALAADPASVKAMAANSKLDTQLAALSADARDFGDRASRTQERIDLKQRQEAERKKRIEEAARKEALRPKFALPVKLHQLSARFGQSGVNWMSRHTGIDFPVFTGTPVMAVTDGTVRTQLNSAYGNMVIVTAPDGTETWYCHLSSAKIRSGKVQAGDVIAYSGDSGNSTGPHLHLEVRPNGGGPIDPLPWLIRHGINPLS
ncbi:M23 family metallopeptidase [Streptomyces sp. NPDC048717]|uniref:M23 family metallopeptidase n=1 Tax=Streptomyces sp. NPDC048717 TaxID=3154928 RepID=UPI0034424885